MNNKDQRVLERINDAIKICKIKTKEPRSILFGLEKTGAIQLIDTANNVLTKIPASSQEYRGNQLSFGSG